MRTDGRSRTLAAVSLTLVGALWSGGVVPARADAAGADARIDASSSERVGESVLIRHRGHHPFNALFGLPSVAARSGSGSHWQVALEQGNNFAGGREGDEALLMDGESGELVLRHGRPLGKCWQGEAVVPLVFHHGGWADRAIDDWHQRFGLPDAARDESAPFDLRYAYVASDGETYRLDEQVVGPGDVHLALQRSVGCGAGTGVVGGTGASAVVRFGVKLPSGDVDRLLGSGATDVYVDVLSPVLRAGSRLRLAASAGGLVVGESKLFERQRRFVGYGSFGLSLRLLPRWELLLQSDWHTPFHDSELRELGAFAASLAGGVRYGVARGQRVELVIAEDAVIDTYPDIVARLAWTWSGTGR